MIKNKNKNSGFNGSEVTDGLSDWNHTRCVSLWLKPHVETAENISLQKILLSRSGRRSHRHKQICSVDHFRLVFNKRQPLSVFNEMFTQPPHDGMFALSSRYEIAEDRPPQGPSFQPLHGESDFYLLKLPHQSIKHNQYFERDA